MLTRCSPRFPTTSATTNYCITAASLLHYCITAVCKKLTAAMSKVPDELSDYMEYCDALAQIDKRQWALEDDVADSYRCAYMLCV